MSKKSVFHLVLFPVSTITVSVYHISFFQGNEHIFFFFSFSFYAGGLRRCGRLSGRNVVYWELVAFWRVGGLPNRSVCPVSFPGRRGGSN